MNGEMAKGICGRNFIRPSDLISHYERGECQFITASQFQAERQHKHIIKQILADPGAFESNFYTTQAMSQSGSVTLVSSTASSVAGGVGLLDDDDTSSVSDIGSLQPRVKAPNFMDQEIDEARVPNSKTQTQNDDPYGSAMNRLTNMANRARPLYNSSSDDQDEDGISDTQSEAESMVTVVPLDELTRTPSIASISDDSVASSTSESLVSKFLDYREALSEYMAIIKEPDVLSTVDWSHYSTCDSSAASLIDDSPLKPSTGTTQRQQVKVEETQKHLDPTNDHSSNKNNNIFTSSAWYDPHSTSYTADLFWHPLIEEYKCPFPFCQSTFRQKFDMEHHLKYTHVVLPNRCPECHKSFKTVTGLVSHFEASVRGSKCFIADRSKFGVVLNELCGGFVDVEIGRSGRKGSKLDESWQMDGKKVVKSQKNSKELVGKGVMGMEFQGAVPQTWEDNHGIKDGLIVEEGAENKLLSDWDTSSDQKMMLSKFKDGVRRDSLW